MHSSCYAFTRPDLNDCWALTLCTLQEKHSRHLSAEWAQHLAQLSLQNGHFTPKRDKESDSVGRILSGLLLSQQTSKYKKKTTAFLSVSLCVFVCAWGECILKKYILIWINTLFFPPHLIICKRESNWICWISLIVVIWVTEQNKPWPDSTVGPQQTSRKHAVIWFAIDHNCFVVSERDATFVPVIDSREDVVSFRCLPFVILKLIANAVSVSDRDTPSDKDDADTEAWKSAWQGEREEEDQKTLQSQSNPVLHYRMLWNPKHKAVPELSVNCIFFLSCLFKLVMQEEVITLSELDRQVPV